MKNIVENKNKSRENSIPEVYAARKITLLTLTPSFLITKVKNEIRKKEEM